MANYDARIARLEQRSPSAHTITIGVIRNFRGSALEPFYWLTRLECCVNMRRSSGRGGVLHREGPPADAQRTSSGMTMEPLFGQLRGVNESHADSMVRSGFRGATAVKTSSVLRRPAGCCARDRVCHACIGTLVLAASRLRAFALVRKPVRKGALPMVERPTIASAFERIDRERG